MVWPTGQWAGQGCGGGTHIVSQEGNAVGKALAIWHQIARGITSTNPAVIDVQVYVAQVPPSILCQPVSHLHEELLTGKGQGRGLLSGPAWASP